MRTATIVMGAALALAGCNPAAAPVDPAKVNFDAVCSMDSPPGEGRRYSIDLERKVWCVTGPVCAATQRPIVSADGDTIVLMAGVEGSLKLTGARLEGQQAGEISGVCTRSTFTPAK